MFCPDRSRLPSLAAIIMLVRNSDFPLRGACGHHGLPRGQARGPGRRLHAGLCAPDGAHRHRLRAHLLRHLRVGSICSRPDPRPVHLGGRNRHLWRGHRRRHRHADLFPLERKISFWKLADLVAPGLVLGQAIGRWGNFFNQELAGVGDGPAWQYFPYAVYIERSASGTRRPSSTSPSPASSSSFSS